MHSIMSIFIKAILLYLLFTLPSLLLPPMYFFSAVFALAVCWVAGIVFGLGYCLILKMKSSYAEKMVLLQLFAAIGVLAAFLCIETFGLWDNIWQEKIYLLFPLAAWLAAAVSITINKAALKEVFSKKPLSYEPISENSL